MSARGTPDRPLLLTAGGWLIWAGAVAAFGLLLFFYRHLGGLAEGHSRPFLPTLIDETTGALVWGILFFPIRALVRRRRLTRIGWRSGACLYAAVALVSGATATTLMWGIRSLLYPLAALGRYDYGAMPLRYAMEFPVQLIGFSVMVFVLHAFEKFREAKEHQVRAAETERALAQAQLRTLRLQLQPHFLFNALNTISSTMYSDPAAADEMLAQLSDLLRASLKTVQTDEVPLASELEVLEAYLGLMRARFGERLHVALRVEPRVERALVPSMMLQPIVENAIRHGRASRSGEGSIDISARAEGDSLQVTVEDDGPGVAADGVQGGLGLSATADRLALLYGRQHQFHAGNKPGGGFAVTVVLPLRAAPDGQP